MQARLQAIRDRINHPDGDIQFLLTALEEVLAENIGLTNAKNSIYADAVMYKKSCDDLVVLKEKRYADIEQSQGGERVLREAARSLIVALDDHHECDGLPNCAICEATLKLQAIVYDANTREVEGK